MANTIRLRRGTTAPTAGSFVEGEPAWDSTNGRLYVKNAAGTMVQIGAAGGTPAGSNTQIQFNNSGAFGADANLTFSTALGVLASYSIYLSRPVISTGITSLAPISVGALGFAAPYLVSNFQSSQSGYLQTVLQNTSSNSGASCDFVVCNDASTDSTNYGNFGINSSAYSGTGIFNQPNAVYVTSTSGPIGIGTTTDHDICFSRNAEATNSLTLGATDATFGKTIKPRVGTATAGTAPLDFTPGTNLTTPEAGAVEYDGTFFYETPTTVSGRAQSASFQTFRLTTNGTATTTTIANYFGATSAINLAATSVYEIEFFAYLLKNTAGTLVWTLTASNGPTLISGIYRGSPVTGIAAGAPITGYAGSRSSTVAAFAATASVGANAFMAFEFHTRVVTNLATTFKLQVTNSAGTVTPQAGSYYTVRQVSGTTGSFA